MAASGSAIAQLRQEFDRDTRSKRSGSIVGDTPDGAVLRREARSASGSRALSGRVTVRLSEPSAYPKLVSHELTRSAATTLECVRLYSSIALWRTHSYTPTDAVMPLRAPKRGLGARSGTNPSIRPQSGDAEDRCEMLEPVSPPAVWWRVLRILFLVSNTRFLIRLFQVILMSSALVSMLTPYACKNVRISAD